MKNLKLYLYIGIAGLILILGGALNIYYGKFKTEKAEKERHLANEQQLLQNNSNLTVLNLKQKEVTGKVKQERDSLAEALKIKPKQIIKYVDWYITVHDTVPKEVKVTKLTDSTYYIADSTACWKWEGMAIVDSGRMEVKRLSFIEGNTVSDVTYWYRKWFLGKKHYTRTIKPKCGEAKVMEVNIIKK